MKSRDRIKELRWVKASDLVPPEIDPGYVAVTLERLSALGLAPELISESNKHPEWAA